jgi:hypothetical protein
MVHCSNRCFEDKTFGEFSLKSTCIFRLSPSCRVCIKLNRKALAEENKEEEEESEEAKEEKESDDDENIRTDAENGSSSMTPGERTRECTRRNQARRETEGESATSKWCNRCFEDKTFDDFTFVRTCIFGRCSICKACIQAGLLKCKVRDDGDVEDEEYKEGDESHDDKDEEYARSEEAEEAEEEEDDEEGEEGKEEEEEDEEEEEADDEENVRTDERTQECTSRNQAWREAEGDLATSKWCNRCFEDKTFDTFSKMRNCIFGLSPSCKVCIKDALLHRKALTS